MKNFAIEAPTSVAAASGGQTAKKATWNQPFPIPVAPFPVKRRIPPAADTTVFGSENRSEGREDLPDYLPELPPAHTYKRARRRITKKTSASGDGQGRIASQSNSRSIQGALSLLEEKSSK